MNRVPAAVLRPHCTITFLWGMAHVSAAEAVALVKPGDRVFVHGSAATPITLLHALFDRARELRNVEIVSITLLGDIGLDKPGTADAFFINSLFVSASVRDAVNSERGDHVPIFLSGIPQLFSSGLMPIDVALLQVSPPDRHGLCSLGTSVDVARAAVRNARTVIAQVNPHMPRTHGDGHVHIDRFAALVHVHDPLPEVDYAAHIGDREHAIAAHCAALIEDGSTLQMGIGAIPDAILRALQGHKDLGVHTEMCSNGIIPLLEKGVVTNRLKKKHPGRTVASFALGTRRLYDLVDDNPDFAFLDVAYVNDGHVIRQNPKVVAINSAIELDLTGQVCADSIGTWQYSGVGGQMDFMHGAAHSPGGKPIIAMASVTERGESKIVPFLRHGAGVVTTRAHIHWVVTEYGAVNLHGMNLRQRAKALIAIAHPEHREALDMAARERYGKGWV